MAEGETGGLLPVLILSLNRSLKCLQMLWFNLPARAHRGFAAFFVVCFEARVGVVVVLEEKRRGEGAG